mmetsp:Transcript_30656/g.70781  ORF Transcript_30656/g.70781 Transcript_30656/m.70781 type:complete len:370 (-) Transcript_30656:164-1273(-)
MFTLRRTLCVLACVTSGFLLVAPVLRRRYFNNSPSDTVVQRPSETVVQSAGNQPENPQLQKQSESHESNWSEAWVCFGKTQCSEPLSAGQLGQDDFQKAWQDYLRTPSGAKAGGPKDPLAHCCSTCKDIRTTQCTNSRAEEQHFLGHIYPFMTIPPNSQGLFLELGGNVGWRETNTLFLEHCMGWKGILIEGDPSFFREMSSYRLGTLNVRSAVCKDRGTVPWEIGRAGGMNHIRKEFKKESIRLACTPLRDVFALLDISYVTFLSLDVEGFELPVVESIDWSKVSVGAMVVEELTNHPQKNKNVRRFLTQEANLTILATHCWKPTACDTYFINPTRVDEKAARQHLQEYPLPHLNEPIARCRPARPVR